jgi:integrase
MALLRAQEAAYAGRLRALDGKTTDRPATFLGALGVDPITLQPAKLSRPAVPRGAALRGPWALFQDWIEAAQPAASTVNRWRCVFLALQEKFRDRAFTEDEARAWCKELITPDRSANVVNTIWRSAANTVYRWGVEQRKITENPFRDVRVTVPKRRQLRETKAFSTDEWQAILRASKAVELTYRSSPFKRAQRWCNFLAAYSGARMGEVAMLTKEDCQKRDGIPVIVFSEAGGGTLKTGITRVVPIHAELVREGWLDFVAGCPAGPMFYSTRGQGESDDPTNPARPRYVKTRERLAAFVRDLGITDEELSPTHAWRHTFKMLAHRSGMTEKASDQITGHEQKTVARSYGQLTIPDLAAELAKFPAYQL